MNLEPSSCQAHSLLHAPQSQTLPVRNAFHIEPFAVIRDGQVKCVIDPFQLHPCMGRSAVLLYIPDCFLHDPKQTQRNCGSHETRNILMKERNLRSLLSGKFLAERCDT